MKFLVSISDLRMGLGYAATRHPVLAFVALLASSCGVVLVQLPRSHARPDLAPLTFALFFWLIFSLALACASLLGGWWARWERRLAVLGALPAAGICWALAHLPREADMVRFALWGLAAAALGGVALASRRGDEDFQRSFLLRALGSALVSALLSGAAWLLAAGAVAGVNMLLVELTRIDAHVASLAFLFLGMLSPLLFMGCFEGAGGFLEAWNRLFEAITRFVFLPAIVVYELILTVYALKIAVAGVLPSGTVGLLVSLCAVLALAVQLLLPPAQGRGEVWLRRGILGALLPFLGLLWLAIWQRVAQYGITDERYLLVALAFTLSVCVLWALVRGRDLLPFLAIVVLGVALVAASGSLGFRAVSLRSQQSRFLGLLQSQGLWEAGVWKPSPGELPWEVRASLTSTLQWMERNGPREWLTPHLPPAAAARWNEVPPCKESPERCLWQGRQADNAEAVLHLQGVEPARHRDRDGEIVSSTRGNLPGHTLLAQPQGFAGEVSCGLALDSGSPAPLSVGNFTLSFGKGCTSMSLAKEGRELCSVAGIDEHFVSYGGRLPPEALLWRVQASGCLVRFVFHIVQREIPRDPQKPRSFSFKATLWWDLP